MDAGARGRDGTPGAGTEMTRVVNVRHDAFDVYIGRGSPYGNPYPVWEEGREEAVRKFTADFHARLRFDPEYRARILALRGKRLG